MRLNQFVTKQPHPLGLLRFEDGNNNRPEVKMIRNSLRCCLSSLLVSLALINPGHAQQAPSANTGPGVDQRVRDLLKRMTLEEKATMLSGSGWMESAPIARLGIPAIKMADGPAGVRSWAGSSAITNSATNTVKVETTSFPSGIAMGSTWDLALVEREGHAIGQEVKA